MAEVVGIEDPPTPEAGAAAAELDRSPPRRRLPGAPWLVHLITLVGGLIILLNNDRRLWFFGDEWDFIVNRGLHHPVHSIWQPHNEHWSTLPILLWRLLFTVFGLRSYTPYLVPTLVCHLVLAHVIWRVCLRERVHPWVATSLVAMFIVLGSGWENLTWAFQVGFVASVMFGYLALFILDHHRRTMGRDLMGALALLAGLMCSTLGDTMVVVVAVVLFRRRGIKDSVTVLWLPVLAYLAWYLLVGWHAVASDHLTLTTMSQIPSFVWTGFASALGATFGLPDAGPALLVGLVAWTIYSWPALSDRRPAILACTLGSFVFFIVTALGRSHLGGAGATPSRYAYTVIALLIPAIGAALSPSAIKRLGTLAVTVGLICLVIIGNVSLLSTSAARRTTAVLADKTQLLTTATLLAGGAESIQLYPARFDGDLTPAKIKRLVAQGTLPLVKVTPAQRLQDEAHMAVILSDRKLFPAPFKLVALGAGTDSHTARGCMSIAGSAASPAQIVLAPTGHGSSALLSAPPASTVVAFIQLRGGAATSPGTNLTVPKSGTGYLSDVDTRDWLILSLPVGGTTTICNVTAPVHRATGTAAHQGSHPSGAPRSGRRQANPPSA